MDSAIEPWKQLLLNGIQFTPQALLIFSACIQATVGSNGRPANRTVGFRGFQEDSDRIQINTDSRTHKIEDLKHCPFVEICWYFTDSLEQFRINGIVDIIDGSNPDPLKLQIQRYSVLYPLVNTRLTRGRRVSSWT